MKSSRLFKFTGIAGILLYLLVLLEIPLYFFYTPTPAGTPPVPIILYRIGIDLLICLGAITFFSGLKTIIDRHTPQLLGTGTLLFAAALCFAIVSLVADSMQAGAAWGAGSQPVNPTFVGQGANGALLIYGPINRLLTTMMLVTGSAWLLQARLLPRWMAWLGFVCAVYNAAFIPTYFFMTTPLDFYSVNGWNIPLAAGMFFLWILVVSIGLVVRSKRQEG
ncbi:hypothetical protein [Paraflavitalea pollutisoli]|uniref:hypothetical protein n=1 Tax=Paraflavitalea pollutisoli TaxID=3034143 RepID=UPI0023EB5CA7|nr:hypothetical protein [Paraflavitalea sp. H1-2-19X]